MLYLKVPGIYVRQHENKVLVKLLAANKAEELRKKLQSAIGNRSDIRINIWPQTLDPKFTGYVNKPHSPV